MFGQQKFIVTALALCLASFGAQAGQSNGVITGPRGNTVDYSGTSSYDRETHTLTRDGTATGENGKTVTMHGTANYDPATGATSSNKTYTGANGKTATEVGSGHYDKATKTWTGERTYTGPKGKTSTVTGTRHRTGKTGGAALQQSAVTGKVAKGGHSRHRR